MQFSTRLRAKGIFTGFRHALLFRFAGGEIDLSRFKKHRGGRAADGSVTGETENSGRTTGFAIKIIPPRDDLVGNCAVPQLPVVRGVKISPLSRDSGGGVGTLSYNRKY